MKSKEVVFIIIFMLFSLFSISSESGKTDICFSICFSTDGSKFYFRTIHKDLLLNLNEILYEYKEIKFCGDTDRLKILEEKNNILKDEKYREYINKNQEILNEVESYGIRPYIQEYYDCIRKIVLTNIDLQRNLDNNHQILFKWLSEVLIHESSNLLKDDLGNYYVNYKINMCYSDIFFYLGVNYYYQKDYERAYMYLNKFINTTVYQEQTIINDLLFYLDTYYYLINSMYSMKEFDQDIMKEIFIYIKDCDSILIEKESDSTERKEIKCMLNDLWSLKDNYNTLKMELKRESD